MLTKIFILCLVPEWVPSLDAQSLYGSIVGNVNDPSDAPIAGAKVALHNTENGQSRETLTSEAGRYNFSDVATGTYDIAFSAVMGSRITCGNVARH